MNQRLLIRKWQEEQAVSAKYAQISPRPVSPTLEHDDGRFRVYKAGEFYFIVGEITDPRPALRKVHNGWEALTPQLNALAADLTKQYPYEMPGKSSSTRTRMMREMVALTPKGFGLGDNALWNGLAAKKDFDEAQHPRAADGKFTDKADGLVGRPGTGPDPHPSTSRLLAAQESWKATNSAKRWSELAAQYATDKHFQQMVQDFAAQAEEEALLTGGAEDTRTEEQQAADAMERIHGAWAVDVAATPIAGAFQRLVRDKFGLTDTHNGTPGYIDVDGTLSKYGPFLKRLVDDTYQSTQKRLAELGVTEVQVTRALKGIPEGVPPGYHAQANLKSLPISSWTTQRDLSDVANRFAGTPGTILRSTVPAAKIFSLGGHGVIGSAGEYEAVVVGDKLSGEVWAWTQDAGERPEGVWKMTLDINVDANPEDANWLHPKPKTSLRDQVAKAVNGKFDERKHDRYPEGNPKGGQFKPKDEAPDPGLPSSLRIPGVNVPAVGAGEGSAQTPAPLPLPAPAAGEVKAKEAPKKLVITPEMMRPPKYAVVPFGKRLGTKTLPNGTVFSVDEGDLLGAPVEAIVNPANADLQHGGGVAGAIRDKGGYVVQVMSDNWIKKNGKASPKRAAVTAAGSLPHKAIVHAVAPIWGGGKFHEESDMTNAYLSALKSAHVNNFKSIAFPSLGTGIFGNPLSVGTRAALRAVEEFDKAFPASPLKEIHIVVRPQDKDTYEAFENMINDRPVVDKVKEPKPDTWTRDWKPSGGSKAGAAAAAQMSGWYKPAKPAAGQLGLPLEPAAKPAAAGKPLVSDVVSNQILELADTFEANDKPLAMAIADLEAELFQGNHQAANSAFNSLPREVREQLPATVSRLFAAPQAAKPQPQPKSQPKPQPKPPAAKPVIRWQEQTRPYQDKLPTLRDWERYDGRENGGVGKKSLITEAASQSIIRQRDWLQAKRRPLDAAMVDDFEGYLSQGDRASARVVFEAMGNVGGLMPSDIWDVLKPTIGEKMSGWYKGMSDKLKGNKSDGDEA